LSRVCVSFFPPSPETITPVLAIKAPPVVMDSGLARKRAPRNDGSMD
jgi:hypothetical protein